MAQVIPRHLFADFVNLSQDMKSSFDAVDIGIAAIVLWNIYNIQILIPVLNQLPI